MRDVSGQAMMKADNAVYSLRSNPLREAGIRHACYAASAGHARGVLVPLCFTLAILRTEIKSSEANTPRRMMIKPQWKAE